MGAFTTIFLIFLAQWTYLHATPLADLNKDCDLTDETVKMLLFTRTYARGKDIGVQECCENIDKSKPIAFLVHGFTSNANNSEAHNVADQLVKHDYTVFSVDWQEAACSLKSQFVQLFYYNYAADNTVKVGEYAAKYVEALVKECDVSLDQITFIGHSLGGHVSGFAGKKIKDMGLGTLPLIVAMDPADPNFRQETCGNRLCKTDAKRVVTLHTSGLGLPFSVGDLDLYFHNQETQPGCGGLFNIDVGWICSHTRSVEYVESLMRDNCGFIGVPQKAHGDTVEFPNEDDTNCIYLDSKVLDKDDTKTGSYYVFVDPSAPYCTENSLSCSK